MATPLDRQINQKAPATTSQEQANQTGKGTHAE